jgi:hypothetical protein
MRQLNPSDGVGLAHPVGHFPVQRPGSLPPLTQSKLVGNITLHITYIVRGKHMEKAKDDRA